MTIASLRMYHSYDYIGTFSFENFVLFSGKLMHIPDFFSLKLNVDENSVPLGFWRDICILKLQIFSKCMALFATIALFCYENTKIL